MEKNELSIIKERVQTKKEQLVQEGLTAPSDKELVMETVGERVEESLRKSLGEVENIEIQKTPFPSQLSSLSQEPADKIIEEANIKLSELVNIALEENIPKAVTIALKTGNAFLIDKLRDSLADRYYEQLKDKKLI